MLCDWWCVLPVALSCDLCVSLEEGAVTSCDMLYPFATPGIPFTRHDRQSVTVMAPIRLASPLHAGGFPGSAAGPAAVSDWLGQGAGPSPRLPERRQVNANSIPAAAAVTEAPACNCS
jgi:hypothetical protein